MTKKAPGETQKAKIEELERTLADLKGRLAMSLPPLVLTVAMDRLTGRTIFAMTADKVNAEPDIRLLLEATRQIERELSEELVRLVERRVRSEVDGGEGKEGQR